MFKILGWDKLLIFYYFENLVYFVLNLNRLFYQKFLEIVLICNDFSNLFKINQFWAKVT